jgi:hypothetical protein
VRRFIPQFLAVAWCSLRGHRQTRYSAWREGVQVVAYTCMCGREQKAHVLPANRRIRRAAAKRR